MSVKQIVFLIFFGWVSYSVFAQYPNERPVFRKLDEKLGLSNSNVLCFLRDRDGLMWFGTAYGLFRYDGTRIKSFYHTKDSTSISHNSISKIFQGPENKLWIKNVNGTYDIYDPASERFARGLDTFTSSYPLASDSVGMIYTDRQGNFWFTHPTRGLTFWDADLARSRVYSAYDRDHPLHSDRVAFLTEDREGKFWILYQDGVVEIRSSRDFRIEHRIKIPRQANAPLANFEMLLDTDGDAWIFDPDRDSGLFWVQKSNLQISKNSTGEGVYRLNNNMVKTIVEAKPGQIWLGTDHGGINIIEKSSQKITYLIDDPVQGTNENPKVVYALFKDPEDIIWVGTHKQGIAYYHQGLLRFAHIQKVFDNPNSLPFNDVNAFAEDSLGNLFIGTNGGGLYYYEKDKNSYQHFVHDPDDPESLTGDIIVDLIIDHSGILWIGTYLNGLGSFDGKRFTNFPFRATQSNGIPGPSIWKLYEDRHHNLWIGTLRSGMAMLDPDRKRFTHYQVGREPFFIHNQYITSFEEDQEGNLWIGGGSGINVINTQTLSTQLFTEDQDFGLADGYINELYRDGLGVMWLATARGLHYFDTRDSTFVHFGEEDGLPSDFLIDMLEDQRGNLWISTQKGLSYAQIDRNGDRFKISFQNFDQKDGLQALLFNKNSAYKTREGHFIFGGPNGYNIFRSENFAFDQNNPRVVFTDLQVFNEEIQVGATLKNRTLLKESLIQTPNLVLRHDENIFSIGFSVLNYLTPEKNKYRYKLLGFNSEWIYLDDDQAKVTFTNLDPGNYTLVVQPGTVLEGWSDREYSLQISILAPFWKTPLAYLVYLLILIVLAWYFRNQWMTRQREKFASEQAILETKRMQELDRMKTKFFTNISHEFRTPLSLILTPAEHLISQEQNPKIRSQYQLIQRNARRLLKLINQLLDVKNIEKGALSLYPSEGDVVMFVKNCLEDFRELSDDQNIRLDFDYSVESQQAIFDSEKLEKILFNLLSNAFKFTPVGGAIQVTLDLQVQSEEMGQLKLIVKDTGSGIRQEDLPRVFDRYFTTEGHTEKLNQGSGIGLSLAQDFARLMGGELGVDSQWGQGACFTLVIPVTLVEVNFPKSLSVSIQDPLTKGKELILIAEDHEDFRNYLRDCLSDQYEILLAPNGEAAWELVEKQLPDLIISDLMMPGMNGNELCAKVKSDIRTSHIPVILLTAKKSEENLIRGLDSGCSLYLTKPFNLEVLQLSIKNLIKMRGEVQEKNRKKIEFAASEVEVESLDDRLIQKAVQLVEKHLENPELTVEFLSRELGMSRVHLYKKLHSLTGKTPVEFIRLIRVQRAAQLLEKSQMNVSEVAFQVGYSNPRYFSKHFKEEYGMMPSEYVTINQKKTKTHHS